MAGFCREDILMEDNDILVVHKHAGMAVQNARMGQMDLEHALLNYLAKQARAETPGQARTQIPYLAVVHRLDQPVEGVLVFAKNKDAAGKLGRQVKDGTMKKEYLAVCEGKIEKQGVQKFEDFLVKDGRSNTSRVVQPGTAGAKKAVLEYEVIRTQENPGADPPRTGPPPPDPRPVFPCGISAGGGCKIWGERERISGAVRASSRAEASADRQTAFVYRKTRR